MANGGGDSFGKTTYLGLEQTVEYNCVHCEKKNIYKDVLHSCQTCNCYFCDNCFQIHNEFPHTNGHWITDMSLKADEEECPDHVGKKLTVFCGQHDVLCCPVCVSNDHQSCDKKMFLQEKAKGISMSKDFQYVKTGIDRAKSDVHQIVTVRTEMRKNVDKYCQNFMDILKSFRSRINALFNELEMKAIEDKNKLCDLKEKDISSDICKCEDLMNELDKLKRTLENDGANEPVLFIRMKKSQRKILECKHVLGDMSQVKENDTLVFTIDPEIVSFLENIKSLGSFNVSDFLPSQAVDVTRNLQNKQIFLTPEENLTQHHTAEKSPAEQHTAEESPAEQHTAEESPAEQHSPEEILAEQHTPEEGLAEQHTKEEILAERHLPEESSAEEHTVDTSPTKPKHSFKYTVCKKEQCNVRVKQDQRNCFIEGICQLQNGHLLLSDSNNNSLKVMDNKTHTIVKHFTLPACPSCICCTGPYDVAVALENHTIQFVSVEGSMQTTRFIQLDHGCFGLAHYSGKLYVTEFDSTKVYVYNTFGTLLHTIHNDMSGKEIFSSTQHVCVSEDGERLYVADFNKGLVTLDSHGELLSVLCHPDHNGTYGVCTGAQGDVFVCGLKSGKVVQTGDRGTMVLGVVSSRADGLYYPRSLWFDSKQSKLIVSNNPRYGCVDTLFVFTLNERPISPSHKQ